MNFFYRIIFAIILGMSLHGFASANSENLEPADTAEFGDNSAEYFNESEDFYTSPGARTGGGTRIGGGGGPGRGPGGPGPMGPGPGPGGPGPAGPGPGAPPGDYGWGSEWADPRDNPPAGEDDFIEDLMRRKEKLGEAGKAVDDGGFMEWLMQLWRASQQKKAAGAATPPAPPQAGEGN